jgi:hypothetical protein
MSRNVFYEARPQVHRAIARGELEPAFRWRLIMREQVDIARRYNDLIGARPILKPRRRKSAPEAKPSMPVMLDPKGFSPGGAPNWLIFNGRNAPDFERRPDPHRLGGVKEGWRQNERP